MEMGTVTSWSMGSGMVVFVVIVVMVTNSGSVVVVVISMAPFDGSLFIEFCPAASCSNITKTLPDLPHYIPSHKFQIILSKGVLCCQWHSQPDNLLCYASYRELTMRV